MKKIVKTIIFLICALILVGCKKNDNKSLLIVTSNFPSYDFTRAIIKDSNISVQMLLKPGSEIHDFEPTPQDIIKIEDSSIFIYTGGESDSWVQGILKEKIKTKVIKLIDLVETYEEEITEGMDEIEEEKEIDEHVWTSPLNAIKIVSSIKEEIIKLDPQNKQLYEKNAENYISELTKVDKEIKDIVSSSKRKEVIFGDRFPLRYFTQEYGLTYYAAFKGCSESTEASAKTLTFLINKVKEDKIPVVFKIELSNGKIAESIARETGVKILEFHSAHNISKSDFENGITYIDIMINNIKVLREALN